MDKDGNNQRLVPIREGKNEQIDVSSIYDDDKLT